MSACRDPPDESAVCRHSRLIREQVNAQDDDDDDSNTYTSHQSQPNNATPSSPPPSFRSRSSSHSRWLLHDESRRNDADQTLADTFGDGSDSEGDDEPDDRQRLMRANPQPQAPADAGNAAGSSSAGARDAQHGGQPGSGLQRRPTEFPSLGGGAAAGPGRVISSSNDGVFANLDAKPERGEKSEDLPPVCCLLCWFSYLMVLLTDVVVRGSCRRCHPPVLGDHHPGPRYLVR